MTQRGRWICEGFGLGWIEKWIAGVMSGAIFGFLNSLTNDDKLASGKWREMQDSCVCASVSGLSRLSLADKLGINRERYG